METKQLFDAKVAVIQDRIQFCLQRRVQQVEKRVIEIKDGVTGVNDSGRKVESKIDLLHGEWKLQAECIASMRTLLKSLCEAAACKLSAS